MPLLKLNKEIQKVDTEQISKDFVCHDKKLFFFSSRRETLKDFYVREKCDEICFGKDVSEGREVDSIFKKFTE